LVDFDATCAAEPALDLGRFTGHLAVTASKAYAAAGRDSAEDVRQLSQRFLTEYRHAAGVGDGSSLLSRTAAYRRVSLTRTAIHSWRQLKPARVLTARRLLEEELPGPGTVETAAHAVPH
jgi:uncharacterized protein (DUF2252 family)